MPIRFSTVGSIPNPLLGPSADFVVRAIAGFVLQLEADGGGSAKRVQWSGTNLTGPVGAAFNIRAGVSQSLVLGANNGTGVTFDGNNQATFAGIVITPATVAGSAGLRLPHGTVPSAPVDGDVWTTSAGLFVRINGATVGPLS